MMDHKTWQKKVRGHRQRLRDRFLKYGLSSFTEYEILELLLSFGTPRQDCRERAKAALRHFGSLAAVLEAPISELQVIRGIGPYNAFAVRFIHEIARKFLKHRVEGRKYIRASSDVVDYLCHSLSLQKREIFVVVFLDASHHIIAVEELFKGTLNSSAVYPREVIKRALDCSAAAMVFAHNHPSGNTNPSAADKALTRRLYLAARLMDMEVLDHIIIGGTDRFFSFSDEGIMAAIKNLDTDQVAEIF